MDSKHKLLGLDKAKDWNLMANYRDVTDLMNALAFETARYMGMPHTNHTRYVELFLNGEYIGLYQLTEKIEVDDNRVDIDREGGVMLSFDQDDGPSLSPNATDNFWSTVYSLPMCVKYPDDPTAEQLAQAKADFTVLEKAIKAQNFAMVDSLMDVSSFISILQLHEYLYNVEIDAPRSLYMYRDKDGKYTFGPVWDWDAAFDFDWGNMYTGHTFFSDYRELIYGTDPYRNTGAAYRVSGFFTDLFNCAGFVTRYKEQWNAVKDSIYLHPWAEAQQWANELNKGAYSRDLARWPISGKKTTSEISKMSQWLQNRLNYLNSVIANYPAGQKGGDDPEEDPTTVTVLNKTMNCYHSLGYSQNEQVVVSQSEVEQLLGGTPTALVPLNADGQEGSNTAAGTYGAWFNSEGSTGDWGAGHIYIESDDLWTWNFGCHPDNCKAGDKHMVTMQYQLGNKRVNVSVTFNLYESADDAPDDPSEDPTIIATLEKTAECTFSQGYKQSAKITVSQSEVELLLGGTPTALVPLNSDGQEGSNTAAGTYGAWFNSEGSTAKWAQGHVYIESNDLWTWNYGCHPDNCSAGDKHTVTMQYQLGSKRVNVSVTFNLQ